VVTNPRRPSGGIVERVSYMPYGQRAIPAGNFQLTTDH
jgi:hypothetical protein